MSLTQPKDLKNSLKTNLTSSSLSMSLKKEDINSQIKKKDDIIHPWYHHFFAGEIAGMIGCFFCHPFDTTRVRIQMLNTIKKPSTFSFIGQTIKQHGFSSLYKGILYPFFGYGVLFSIAFGVNGVMQDYFI